MIKIVNSKFSSPHLIELSRWISEMWNLSIDFKDIKDGIVLPPPLLAVEEEKLVGGLSYTAYAKPESDETGLWINTLIVDPEYRGRKIASLLIKAAEESAIDLKYQEIFVFTNIPVLYEKNGWIKLSEENNDHVLTKRLGCSGD